MDTQTEKIVNKCVNYGKILKSNRSKRCRKCYYISIRGKNHPNYIDGRTNKKVYCKDCHKLLSTSKCQRCITCSNKFRAKIFICYSCMNCGGYLHKILRCMEKAFATNAILQY